MTAMIDMIASVGSPSQFGISNGLRMCVACSSQLMMLYWVSNIHFHAIELSAIGTVHGKTMMKRKKRVPRRFSARRKARNVPSRPFKTADEAVNISVLRRAVRNTDDSKRATKLSTPTKRPSPLVETSALLMLR